MSKKLLLVAIAMLGLVVVATSDTWMIAKQTLEFETENNSSDDTAEVFLTVDDTTAWFRLWSSEEGPAHSLGGDRKTWIPDSIFVTFKSTADGVDTDTCDISFDLQTSEDKTTVSDWVAIVDVTELITAGTSEIMGFTWSPISLLDAGTPLAEWARYRLSPGEVTTDDDDSVDVSDMVNRFFASDRNNQP